MPFSLVAISWKAYSLLLRTVYFPVRLSCRKLNLIFKWSSVREKFWARNMFMCPLLFSFMNLSGADRYRPCVCGSFLLHLETIISFSFITFGSYTQSTSSFLEFPKPWEDGFVGDIPFSSLTLCKFLTLVLCISANLLQAEASLIMTEQSSGL